MSMKYKRGTTFDFTGVVTMPDPGDDLTGWGIEAQIRKEAGGLATDLIANLSASIPDAANRTYRVKATTVAATKTWPLGSAVFDIVFISPAGDRIPTEGFVKFQIIDPATQN